MADSKKEDRKAKRRERWQQFKRALPEALALARPYRGLIALSLGLLLINKIAGLALPAAPKFMIDDAIGGQRLDILYTVIGVVVAATAVQALTMFFMMQTISKAGQRLIRDLRVKLQDHVSRLPLRYFDNKKGGEVASRVMNDVEGLRNLIGTGLVELIGGVITAILAMSILFYLNWKLTVGAVCFLTLFAIVMIRAFTYLSPIFKERSAVMETVFGRLTESASGIRVVKAYHMEEVERGHFRDGVGKILDLILRTINAISIVALSTALLTGVVGAVVMFVGGHQMLLGEMTPGEFISYILYLAFMIGPVAQAVSIGTSMSEAFAGLDRMRELLAEGREDADDAARRNVGRLEGRVEFQDVSFQYEAGKTVLHNVSFTAEPGSITALVGPSGAGKSTVIGLVASFYTPVSGRVIVDGIDLNNIRLGDFRRQLGVVLQDNFLFGGTVLENVRYSRPEAPLSEVYEAARIAHATEFIEKLPQGWDTIIGERGVKLSGGQRQRLAIARALLCQPRILILDEATSALDSESEALIQEGLDALMKGRTTFVIAHRLSTIRHAHQILVMEEGRIVERGSHAELLRARGRYFDMYSRQHGDDGLLLFPGEGESTAEQPSDADAQAGPLPRRRRRGLGELIG